jgi:hypothetical protein
MSDDIVLADLRCARCGAQDVVLIEPGEAEVRELFLLRAGRPVRCLCAACWPAVQSRRAAPP